MLRTIDIIMIGCLLGGVAFTYKIKRDSEHAIARVAELERQIRSEEDLINVLKADWNLLTSPERVHALVERFNEQLSLRETDPAQIGQIGEIPERAFEVPQPGRSGIAGLIETDGSVTGAIPRKSGSAPETKEGRGGEEIE